MNEKAISTKQFVLLVFLLSIAVKTFLMPALVLRTVGRDGIFTIAFFIAVEFLCLAFIVIVCKRNPDKTFFEIMEQCLGKVFSKIVFVVLFIFSFSKAVIIIGEIKAFFVAVMYQDINWAIMVLPLVVLVLFLSRKSLRALGRTAELITPAVLISTLILGSLLLPEFDTSELLPILPDGMGEVTRGIDRFVLWFGDTTTLLLFMGNIKIGKGFAIGTLVAKLVATILTAFFCIVLFSAYGNVSELVDYGNNVSNLTQLSLGSQDYGRFDLLFYCIWLLSVLIKLASTFILSVKCAHHTIKVGVEGKKAIALSVILYGLVAIAFNNEETAFLYATSLVRYIFYPSIYLLPLLTLICALIKYQPNYHKVKNNEQKANE